MKKSFTSAVMFLIVALMPIFACAGEQFIQTLKSETILTQDITISGNLVKKGSMTNTPNVSAYALLRTTNTLNAYGKNFIVINGTGTITMASAPTISTANALSGQEITIMGGSNPVTFSDDGTLTKSALQLGASTRALSTGDILKLIFYKGYWYETAFVNN